MKTFFSPVPDINIRQAVNTPRILPYGIPLLLTDVFFWSSRPSYGILIYPLHQSLPNDTQHARANSSTGCSRVSWVTICGTGYTKRFQELWLRQFWSSAREVRAHFTRGTRLMASSLGYLTCSKSLYHRPAFFSYWILAFYFDVLRTVGQNLV